MPILHVLKVPQIVPQLSKLRPIEVYTLIDYNNRWKMTHYILTNGAIEPSRTTSTNVTCSE